MIFDLPGHGRNEENISQKGFNDLVREVSQFIQNVGGAESIVVGYSLGGRLALAVGIHYPQLIAKLILVSATPGIASESERAARKNHDQRLAQEIVSGGMRDFLESWYSLSVFSTLEHKLDLRHALINKKATLEPHRASASLSAFGPSAQESYWTRLGQVQAEVLLLCGKEDRKFVDIAEKMKREMGKRARVLEIPDSSHIVHLEQADVVGEKIAAFLGNSRRGGQLEST